MKVQYTIKLLGKMNISETATEDQIQDIIARNCYEQGFDIDNINNIEWEVIE